MKEKVRAIMSRIFEIPIQEIPEDATKENMKIWDSMRHILLILALEEEFGVSFPDTEIVEMLSLGAVVSALEKKSAR